MFRYVGYLPWRCGIGEMAANTVGSSGGGVVNRGVFLWMGGVGVGSSGGGRDGLGMSDGGRDGLGMSGGGVPVVGFGVVFSVGDMSDGKGALAAHTSLRAGVLGVVGAPEALFS